MTRTLGPTAPNLRKEGAPPPPWPLWESRGAKDPSALAPLTSAIEHGHQSQTAPDCAIIQLGDPGQVI